MVDTYSILSSIKPPWKPHYNSIIPPLNPIGGSWTLVVGVGFLVSSNQPWPPRYAGCKPPRRCCAAILARCPGTSTWSGEGTPWPRPLAYPNHIPTLKQNVRKFLQAGAPQLSWFIPGLRIKDGKSNRKAIYFCFFFSRQVLELFVGSWFYALLFLRFSAFLLLCFSASLLICFSAFPASLLFCFSVFCFPCFSAFPASLLFCFLLFLLLCFPCFFAFVLLCLSTSTILLFLFFSHVFLLLYFLLLCFFAFCLYCLFCLYPKWNPRETLGESQRKPKQHSEKQLNKP